MNAELVAARRRAQEAEDARDEAIAEVAAGEDTERRLREQLARAEVEHLRRLAPLTSTPRPESSTPRRESSTPRPDDDRDAALGARSDQR